MTGQLAFDLPGDEKLTRAAFCVSPSNGQALAMVDVWRLWPGGMLLLVGPEASGKSHLARIWADEAGARIVRATDLAADLPALTALAALPALVVEDAPLVAGSPAAETALFHLFNLAREAGQPVLFTARRPPGTWGLGLPDLASRMQALALARLDAPDDALLAAVLAKLFADRQVAVAPALIPYLVARMERSIGAARLLVDALDRRAMARGGPITRADAAALFAGTDPSNALDLPPPE